ncbi:hypothetical protein ACJX0J_040548, partial [Zea mays]
IAIQMLNGLAMCSIEKDIYLMILHQEISIDLITTMVLLGASIEYVIHESNPILSNLGCLLSAENLKLGPIGYSILIKSNKCAFYKYDLLFKNEIWLTCYALGKMTSHISLLKMKIVAGAKIEPRQLSDSILVF